uniref:Putative secreted peptide n=1 Tax=Anopheles braziliensis TaxID=58242 RepID=A0A2M3ZSN1_9DIPT
MRLVHIATSVLLAATYWIPAACSTSSGMGRKLKPGLEPIIDSSSCHFGNLWLSDTSRPCIQMANNAASTV